MIPVTQHNRQVGAFGGFAQPKSRGAPPTIMGLIAADCINTFNGVLGSYVFTVVAGCFPMI